MYCVLCIVNMRYLEASCIAFKMFFVLRYPKIGSINYLATAKEKTSLVSGKLM